jgi:hypothetical protein
LWLFLLSVGGKNLEVSVRRSPKNYSGPPVTALQRKLDDLDDAYSAWVLGAFLCSLLAVGGLPFAAR